MSVSETVEPTARTRVWAILIGVGAPAPIRADFRDGSRTKSFAALPTVDRELTWFIDQLKRRIPAEELAYSVRTRRDETNATQVLDLIKDAAARRPGPELLILYLSGHGIQLARPEGPAGRDPAREAFVASEGYVIDSALVSALAGRDPRSKLVSFYDTCHAEGLRSLVEWEPRIRPHLGYDQIHFAISSAKEDSEVPQLSSGGVLYSAMRAIAEAEGLTGSYRRLFEKVARHCERQWGQRIVGELWGPDDSFLSAPALE